MRTIIFIGPQGSGKGTQVDMLAKSLGALDQLVTKIQTGDIFRSLSLRKNYAASKIDQCIRAGNLMPDAITSGLVIDKLIQEVSLNNTILFDGYPRNKAQLNTLRQVLNFFDRDEIYVIHLETSEEIVIKRMKDRGRNDDTDESIRARLATYSKETIPLLENLRDLENVTVYDINGEGSVNDVHNMIVKSLGYEDK